MPLYATRGELDIALDQLRAKLPELVEEFRAGNEFWIAFRAYSDVIVSDASPSDMHYVGEQIDAALAAHDMPPLSESPASK